MGLNRLNVKRWWFDLHGVERGVHLFQCSSVILLCLLTITLSSFSEKWVRNQEEDVSFNSLGLSVEPWWDEGYGKCCCDSHKNAPFRICTKCVGPLCIFECLTPTNSSKCSSKRLFSERSDHPFPPPIQTCPILSTKTRHLNQKNKQHQPADLF